MSGILEWLYPPRCLICSGVITSGAFCSDCAGKVPYLRDNLCDFCGAPLKDGKCSCEPKNYLITGNKSLFPYETYVRSAIYRYKHGGFISMGRQFGDLMTEHLPNPFSGKSDVLVVSVPLSDKRYKERGFNQAHTVAARYSKNLGLKSADILKRTRHTGTQRGLDIESRTKNVEGAFGLSKPDLVKGRHLIIVDDVFTTGSTVNACAKVLLDAGAVDVFSLTLAKTILRLNRKT